MNGWNKCEWIDAEGSATDVAERIARELEEEFSDEAISSFLEGLGH